MVGGRCGDGGCGGSGAARVVRLRGQVGLGDLAEVFSEELTVHAPCVDAEEEYGEGDESEERGDGGEGCDSGCS